MQAYISKVNDVVNQMRDLGDIIPEQLAVGKILRSLGPLYHVVGAIGETKDLAELAMDELSYSLQAHKSFMISQDNKIESKIIKGKVESSSKKEETKTSTREESSSFKDRGRVFLEMEKLKQGQR